MKSLEQQHIEDMHRRLTGEEPEEEVVYVNRKARRAAESEARKKKNRNG